jgi:hypothetical protein
MLKLQTYDNGYDKQWMVGWRWDAGGKAEIGKAEIRKSGFLLPARAKGAPLSCCSDLAMSAFCGSTYVPLNSTWFHLIPLGSTSRPPGGGMNRTSFHVHKQCVSHDGWARLSSRGKSKPGARLCRDFGELSRVVSPYRVGIHNSPSISSWPPGISYSTKLLYIAIPSLHDGFFPLALAIFAQFQLNSTQVIVHEPFTRKTWLFQSSPIKSNQGW